MKRIHGFMIATMIAIAGFGYSYAQTPERGAARATNRTNEVRTTNVTEIVNGVPTTVTLPDQVRYNTVARWNPNSTSNEVHQLLSAYENAQDGAAREEIIKSLTEHVNDEFDERQEERQAELDRLEEQLTKLKDIHKKRAAQKERIVKDRVQQLISNAEGLGWGTNEGGPTAYANPFGTAAVYSVPPTYGPPMVPVTVPVAPARPAAPAKAESRR